MMLDENSRGHIAITAAAVAEAVAREHKRWCDLVERLQQEVERLHADRDRLHKAIGDFLASNAALANLKATVALQSAYEFAQEEEK